MGFREFTSFPFADLDKSVLTVEQILKTFHYAGGGSPTSIREQYDNHI